MRELQRLLDQSHHKIQVGFYSVPGRFRILIVLTDTSHELAAAVPQDQAPDTDAPEITFIDLRDR